MRFLYVVYKNHIADTSSEKMPPRHFSREENWGQGNMITLYEHVRDYTAASPKLGFLKASVSLHWFLLSVSYGFV